MSFIEAKILTYSGLSTDIKPTNGAGDDVLNGSRFREVDKKSIYIFNFSDDSWYFLNSYANEIDYQGKTSTNVVDQPANELLTRILLELRKITLHVQILTDENINEIDLSYRE